MQFIDTHCHIHEAKYPQDVGDVLARAHRAGVSEIICVGTSVKSSKQAVQFASQHEHIYASIGVHPHDTKEGWEEVRSTMPTANNLALPMSNHSPSFLTRTPAARASTGAGARIEARREAVLGGEEGNVEENESGFMTNQNTKTSPIVAVGEIGLDYFYTHSPRDTQIKALEWQINLALQHRLPVIFHVREAFDDFWPIFDNFHGIRGELHSFTDSKANLEAGLKRGLYIGVNGISTFTKDEAQKAMFAAIPLEKMLLETDAPFLTPVPKRGKVNEPAFVRHVAEFHAHARGISLEEIAAATTANARALFALS